MAWLRMNTAELIPKNFSRCCFLFLPNIQIVFPSLHNNHSSCYSILSSPFTERIIGTVFTSNAKYLCILFSVLARKAWDVQYTSTVPFRVFLQYVVFSLLTTYCTAKSNVPCQTCPGWNLGDCGGRARYWTSQRALEQVTIWQAVRREFQVTGNLIARMTRNGLVETSIGHGHACKWW